MTAGPVGLHWNIEGDERDWYRGSENDIVQWHLYGKETYEPHALAAELTRRCGRRGSASRCWWASSPTAASRSPAYEHTHAGIWSATFSGAGVLAHSAPPFNVDSDEPMTDARARHFEALARFLQATADLHPLEPIWDEASATGGVRVWMMGGQGARALWWMAPVEDFEKTRAGVTVTVRGLQDGPWEAEVWDDVAGRPTSTVAFQVQGGRALVPLPPFARHGAAILRRR